MMDPQVSVAMPVRNSAETVGLAIESILHQSLQSWELLAIDDGSTDRTLEILQAYQKMDPRIKVLAFNESQGLAVRLNQAIEAARAPFLARMDGDDVSFPERFRAQFDYLLIHPDIDLLGSAVLVFNDRFQVLGQRQGPEGHDAIVERPYSTIRMAHPTFFGRIEFFRRNLYNPSNIAAEDQDLLRRSFAESTFANLPDVLLGYRARQLTVRQQARRRKYQSISAFQELRNQRRTVQALGAVGEQVVKLAYETIAIRARWEEHMLRHLASPIAETRTREFEALLLSLRTAEASRWFSPACCEQKSTP